MRIKFEIDVNVKVAGMEELIDAIASERISDYDIYLLDTLAAKSERVVKRLQRLDRQTQPAE